MSESARIDLEAKVKELQTKLGDTETKLAERDQQVKNLEVK